MTDNEKLARFQGWKVKAIKPTTIMFPEPLPDVWVMYTDEGDQMPLPDYLNDDAAAMSLLDTLVERGMRWEMKGCKNEVWFEINKQYPDRLGDWTITGNWAATRREAVVSAVLELIKEAGDE